MGGDYQSLRWQLAARITSTTVPSAARLHEFFEVNLAGADAVEAATGVSRHEVAHSRR